MVEICQDVDVSRETIKALEHFAELLSKWTRKINLIAPDGIPHIWDRHIVDSAQILRFIPNSAQSILDLGSGGGLPAIVLATILRTERPDAKTTMIESDLRKATFLRNAIRELDLNASVITDRIDAVPSQSGDVVTARALAALPSLLELVHHHIAPTGVALLPKGRNYNTELSKAQESWRFSTAAHQSLTNQDARILEIRNIQRVTS